MRAMTAMILGAALIASGACAACGGRSEADLGGDGGAGSDSGTVDGGAGSDGGGGGDAGSAACPSAPPFGGSACSRVGLECEWGTSADPYCNTLMTCTSGGWVSKNGGGGACAVTPDAGACAPTYASVPRGQTCGAEGASCSYTEGACYCTMGFGGPQPPPGTQATWRCRDAVPGCPEPRPRIGTACAPNAKRCDYGSCLTGGVMLVCNDATWHDESVPCPL
jgi:hypothetical protein